LIVGGERVYNIYLTGNELYRGGGGAAPAGNLLYYYIVIVAVGTIKTIIIGIGI